MIACRAIATVLLLAALAAFGHEIYHAVGDGYRFIAAGELWARADGNSLVGFQALIEKNAKPWLWSDIVLPVLLAPAWAVPLAPGALLLLACRRRAHRRRRR